MIKNTLFEGYEGPRLSPEDQMKRLRRVMEGELTEKQRLYMEDYFLRNMEVREIAEKYGVARSTVYVTIHRAIRRCRRCLMY